MTPEEKSRIRQRARTIGWRARLLLLAVVAGMIATVIVTHRLLSDRYSLVSETRAELRLALYSGNLLSELRQSAIVPQLLARDQTLISALESNDYSQSTQRLISFAEEIGSPSLLLLDLEGRTVAATDRNRLGANHRARAHFVEAMRSNTTVFTAEPRENGTFDFTYSRRLQRGNDPIGVIVIEVNLRRFERAWAGISDAVLVADSGGRVLLSTEARWRGLTEDQALTEEPPETAIERALNSTSDWTSIPIDSYLKGGDVFRSETRIPFRGWKIVSFSTYDSVRERVNGVIALEIMGFALLIAFLFYLVSRRNAARIALVERESLELRTLNTRLQREIAERERVQKTLAVTEQTLEQSSKLAALGEMSAAVSHELNQPLAAMKTYLAGATLLMRRNRPDEALAAFGRIDSLIERMGGITRQLKSYARKGADSLGAVDMGQVIGNSLAMMEPQLRQRRVQINRTLPQSPVLVRGDQMRLEQVVVNLLRNALDATKTVRAPQLDLVLAQGDSILLSVRDNGEGIANPENLFEPFYTTKSPGEGVGLGLAISSGIVGDHGGRLSAHNGQDGGAVFEIHLPAFDGNVAAAE